MLMNQLPFPREIGKRMTHYERIKTMLTSGEVARLFGVHASTVRKWSEQGIIKAYRIGLRADRRFRRDDVAILFLDKAIQRYFKS